MDPAAMEGKDEPLEFKRVLDNIKVTTVLSWGYRLWEALPSLDIVHSTTLPS